MILLQSAYAEVMLWIFLILESSHFNSDFKSSKYYMKTPNESSFSKLLPSDGNNNDKLFELYGLVFTIYKKDFVYNQLSCYPIYLVVLVLTLIILSPNLWVGI